MAKKKTTVLDFDNDPEIVEEENPPVVNGGANDNGSNSNSNINSNNASILSSVLSKTTKEPKKIYTGFYLDEPVKKTIDKIVKQNKDTNKSKLVNDLLMEAFKQAGLMK
ncbi:hypothetical protein COJ79_12410 [Bacillus thuringiensis]|uniref:hypothetical protein n=1 Tax=Bacillus thuringiensis TaxID=1428 RepID=UPI000BF8B0BA|nr:hypothetical protein [Bacillus thuringiensis]PFO18816.1 hypothetical protein COJ79_12410 [Bacillus thuringiensis]